MSTTQTTIKRRSSEEDNNFHSASSFQGSPFEGELEAESSTNSFPELSPNIFTFSESGGGGAVGTNTNNSLEMTYIIKSFGVDYDYTSNNLRPLFTVELSHDYFPTLEGNKIKKMPFYVSSGSSYTSEQTGKLTCFGGMSFEYYNIESDYGNYFYEFFNKPEIAFLSRSIIEYANSKKTNGPIFTLRNLFKKNFILGEWFIKFDSSFKYNPKTKEGFSLEKYDPYWPGSKEVYDFLGSGACVKEIQSAVARTNTGEEALKYNNAISSYKTYGGIIPYKYLDMYEKGVKPNRVEQLEDMFTVRYCTNQILFDLRNEHIREPYDINERLNKYKINKKIGNNNLFGSYLNGTNLNQDVIDTRLEVKYKRILNYFLKNIYTFIYSKQDIDKLLTNFNLISEKYFEDKLGELIFRCNSTFDNTIQDLDTRINLLKEVFSITTIATLKREKPEDKFENILAELAQQDSESFDLGKHLDENNILAETFVLYYNKNKDFILEILNEFYQDEDTKRVTSISERIINAISDKREINKLMIFFDICVKIFDEITDPETGAYIPAKANKYDFDNDFIDFLTLPIYGVLKVCPRETVAGIKKKRKKSSKPKSKTHKKRKPKIKPNSKKKSKANKGKNKKTKG